MKKLITSICTLAVAAALLGASTFAWFSMNRQVDVQGMKIVAKADSNLVITKGSVPTAATTVSIVDFEDESATNLYASTHDSNYTNYATGLKKVTAATAANIDPTTGLGDDLEYEVATNGDKFYFKDYIVYVCTQGEDAMTNQIIEATITAPEALTDINGAISIDFYAAQITGTAGAPEVNSTNYQGSLNLAHFVNGALVEDYKLVIGSNGITIPTANGNRALAILMRVYVDGSLKETGNTTTFVKSADVTSISAQDIAVQFKSLNKPQA